MYSTIDEFWSPPPDFCPYHYWLTALCPDADWLRACTYGAVKATPLHSQQPPAPNLVFILL